LVRVVDFEGKSSYGALELQNTGLSFRRRRKPEEESLYKIPTRRAEKGFLVASLLGMTKGVICRRWLYGRLGYRDSSLDLILGRIHFCETLSGY